MKVAKNQYKENYNALVEILPVVEWPEPQKPYKTVEVRPSRINKVRQCILVNGVDERTVYSLLVYLRGMNFSSGIMRLASLPVRAQRYVESRRATQRLVRVTLCPGDRIKDTNK
jgi:hypothetical protein